MFKVGTPIIVRDTGDMRYSNDNLYITNEMKALKGRTGKITHVNYESLREGHTIYRVDIDDENWWWDDNLLGLLVTNKGKGEKI